MSALQVPSFEGGRGTELPAGWVRWVDPATDEYYYHNEETGETQRPAAVTDFREALTGDTTKNRHRRAR